MATEAAPPDTRELWSSHPVYARYWQHYHQAMAWMRCHQSAYRRAVESYFSSLWYHLAEAQSPSYTASMGSFPLPFCDVYGRPPHSGPDWASVAEEEEEMEEGEEEEEESESDGVECDVSNMEITEELRQYFAETERHREERRRQQLLDEARLDDYVYADHDLYYNQRRSVEPPSERPGERRQAEMKRLYGDSAAKIQAMEAAVQLSFDKHCDRKRPKYWPVIPLKF